MDPDVAVPARLAARLRAAAAGYRRAGADGPALADLFAGPADAHDRTAAGLEALAQAAGAGAHPAGPTTADARGPWSDLPAALGGGESAVAAATERVEAGLLEDFTAALADPTISGPLRDALLRAYDGVKAEHDRSLQRLVSVRGR